jgi:hypothetical protein
MNIVIGGLAIIGAVVFAIVTYNESKKTVGQSLIRFFVYRKKSRLQCCWADFCFCSLSASFERKLRIT